MTLHDWLELTHEAIVRFGVEGTPNFPDGDHRVGLTVFRNVDRQIIEWVAAVPPSSVGSMEDYARSRGSSVMAADIHIGNPDGTPDGHHTKDGIDLHLERMMSRGMIHSSVLAFMQHAREVAHTAAQHGWRWEVMPPPGTPEA